MPALVVEIRPAALVPELSRDCTFLGHCRRIERVVGRLFEGEESFIERIEPSPKAQFLQESEEEHSTLRDALQQAVIVTNSLAG